MRCLSNGFLAREKHLFELLLGASGVGPSLALKILSGMNVRNCSAIRTRRSGGGLTKIPGVGRKTANAWSLNSKTSSKPWPCETKSGGLLRRRASKPT